MSHQKIRDLKDLRAEIRLKRKEIRQTEQSLEANLRQIAEDYQPGRLIQSTLKNLFQGPVKDPKPWAESLGQVFQWIIEYLLSGQDEKQTLRKNLGSGIRIWLSHFLHQPGEKPL